MSYSSSVSLSTLSDNSYKETTEDRPIYYRYQDPLHLIWLNALDQMKWTLERSNEVFASWNGQGILTLGYERDLDPDDHIAQMILHEVCHACVEGPQSWNQIDWGLHNFDYQDLHREYACHHLQAHLADQVGLRTFFAPTTQWRTYYDRLRSNPLNVGEDNLIRLAQEGWQCFQKSPWYIPIQNALSATQQIQRILTQSYQLNQHLPKTSDHKNQPLLTEVNLWFQD